jgi:alpha-glucosidase
MQNLEWWQSAVFYQIYPRSFSDSNADGIGDLQGIISRLDYLQDLGVDAIWLSPHYQSPQVDFGYDISDYKTVAQEYGDINDFQNLLDGLHQRGMRLILDLVLNHTSDQHSWFQASRSSREDPKRDWYIWRDGKDGEPPNNWNSTFGGSAWEYDPVSDQYYYHFFFKQQPDLNWRNPQVKQAMWDIVRFWLDMGVDGFRLDAIGTIFEDEKLPNHKYPLTLEQVYHESRSAATPKEIELAENHWQVMFESQVDQPGMHELLQDLRSLVDEYSGERVLVGETDDIAYYGDGTNELHMVFNFPLMRTNHLNPEWVRSNQQKRLAALPLKAWPCNTLGNHDSPRVYSQYGDGKHDGQIARISLALVLTLRGTPFLYYGEEIGMTNFLLKSIDRVLDPLGQWIYHMEMESSGVSSEQGLDYAVRYSRDQCRTPMQWANAPNAGFSLVGVQTWLPVNPNYAEGINVEEQQSKKESLLQYYRKLIELRRKNTSLIKGDFILLHEKEQDYLAFLRRDETQTCLVVLNMTDRSHTLQFELNNKTSKLIFSSCDRKSNIEDLSSLSIDPFEIYIAELE